jgi:hypothetical protein
MFVAKSCLESGIDLGGEELLERLPKVVLGVWCGGSAGRAREHGCVLGEVEQALEVLDGEDGVNVEVRPAAKGADVPPPPITVLAVEVAIHRSGDEAMCWIGGTKIAEEAGRLLWECERKIGVIK